METPHVVLEGNVCCRQQRRADLFASVVQVSPTIPTFRHVRPPLQIQVKQVRVHTNIIKIDVNNYNRPNV